jgi:hypothetical protein
VLTVLAVIGASVLGLFAAGMGVMTVQFCFGRSPESREARRAGAETVAMFVFFATAIGDMAAWHLITSGR